MMTCTSAKVGRPTGSPLHIYCLEDYGKETHMPDRSPMHQQIDTLPTLVYSIDHYENLQLLCSHCNRSKGSKTMPEWRAARSM